jgi:hypothetical protein
MTLLKSNVTSAPQSILDGVDELIDTALDVTGVGEAPRSQTHIELTTAYAWPDCRFRRGDADSANL